ncbi:hypothetical protein GPALN_012991 [Globodera pallida]|nr:hypothetical protein GPALN_012991 [Globodera pallida]
MRLLPGPSSSSEEVDDASAEVPRAFWCRPRRRFCLGICVAVVTLMANFAVLFVVLDILLALLRRKCAGGNGQQKAMERIRPNIVRPALLTNFSDARSPIRVPTPAASASPSGNNSVPSSSRGPVALSPPPTPPFSSPSRPSLPFSSSSAPPPTSTRPRLHLKVNGTITNKSSKYWSTSSATTTFPRIRVSAADRMALARENLLTHAKHLPYQQRNHSLTVVTALLDIGRDRWTQYGRTLHQYHQFMRNLLQLRVPMIVIVDEKSAEFVHRERARTDWGRWTKVVQLSPQQLPLAVFQKRISQLMEAELAHWRPEWDPAMRTHPEASQAEYVVVVNSKPYFLAQAAADNPFDSEFFVWLDAGYGHGDRSVFPASWKWLPTFPRDRISTIKLTPPGDLMMRYGLEELYRQDVAVLSGGFLAGDRRAVTRFHREHHRMFLELLEKGRVDDDQTFLVLLVNQHPEWFNIVNGDWFDAFQLF